MVSIIYFIFHMIYKQCNSTNKKINRTELEITSIQQKITSFLQKRIREKIRIASHNQKLYGQQETILTLNRREHIILTM